MTDQTRSKSEWNKTIKFIDTDKKIIQNISLKF